MCNKVDLVNFNDNLYGVIFTPRFHGCREVYQMANEKDRHDIRLEKLMEKHPDWDWEYWKAQVR